jgi:hypothetical protein
VPRAGSPFAMTATSISGISAMRARLFSALCLAARHA